MARHYVLGSWANADEYDYSGEQLMGHRQGKSICMDHMLPNGMANLKRYSDTAFAEPEQKPKVKKKSVADSIDLAEKHFQRMEKLSEELDEEYFAGEIDQERYELLRYKLDERLIKAWRRLEKENSPIWKKQEKHWTKEEIETTIQHKPKTSFKNSQVQWKKADKTMITGEGWQWQALRDCKENNLILVGICEILKLIKKFKGEMR